ncbi:putative ATP-dependent RNA helicase TDRD12 isoform X2 [Maniola jurtina]|uniref:putative ATP-dependent RNA helicase TDRD12 isoform X2 n=1 Tax=Maniola jurtina TaxID=191418 RepID=UPI001E68FC34|nr:putative ATP-dependent RNA helicase TDRD12 isoform X2 [Maniola jurtina]
MPPDCYRVEIVHYLNPHLIWVEVRDPSALKEEFLFEQIGIYGVLPMEKTLDVCLIPGDLSMKSEKCDEWLPAASVAMNELLEKAEKVWFSLTFLDGRTTIFDDNIHKYGEIILKTRGGKLIELSKQLINSGLAHIDVCEFHEKLSCGKLNTKLSTLHTLAVIKRLEEYCTRKDRSENLLKKSLEKQTSVFRLSQEFEKSLTVSNLEKHYNVTLQHTLINKLKDFELCKDVDEQPVGRACSKSKTKLSKSTEEVQKPPETEVSNQSGYSRIRKFLAKKRLESELKHEMNTESKLGKNDAVEVEKLLENVEKTLPDDYCKTEPKRVKSYMVNKTTDETDIYGKEKTRSEEKHFEEKSRHRYDFEGQIKSSSRFEEKISSNRHQEENIDSCKTSKRPVKPTGHKSGVTTRVAYGPPGLNPRLLQIQCITIPDYEEEEYEKRKIHIEEVKTEKRDCMYGDVDSEVGLEITNKKTLKDFLKKGNLVVNCEKTDNVDENFVKSRDLIDIDSSLSCNSSFEVQNEQKIVKSCAGIDYTDDLVEKNHNKTVKKDKFVESGMKMSYRDNSIEKYSKKKIQNESKPVKCATEINNSNQSVDRKPCLLIERKLKTCHNTVKQISNTSSSDTSNKDSSSDVGVSSNNNNNKADDIEEVIERLNLKYNIKDENISKQEDKPITEAEISTKLKNNVNPFKNIDPNLSVFVDNLVTPVLMVHSKHDKRIQPVFEMRDIYFNSHIQNILRNMSVEGPMMLQTVSWFVILRGYSLFMVSPMSSGKTLGYLPAVCRLVSDSVSLTSESGGPLCIIVCATAQSVTNVEKMAKMFLKTEEKVLACYAGVDNFHITTTLLNGCDLLIATPASLVRLLQVTDFGVDLRRLSTFVLDDCERLSEVYADEIKVFTYRIKEMLKRRANKELKVQYILASRIWCDFMEPLAKKAPDTVICIGAFQECVLYSKTNTSVTLVKKENKVESIFEFLKDINASKRTIIVCDSNDEVALLEKALKRSKHIVFSCNNDMTIHDLYNLSVSWADYTEPLLGPILVCCDSNLIHMNITNAHNLIHYSMPPLFSMFCKRFSVLNDNYPSIFKTDNENVKIKILLEESNVEQLPKILNFIKRCTDNVPSVLDEISSNVLKEKDVIKAEKLYPLCGRLLTLGYCPDFYNCQERHTILKEYDAPKECLPKEGTITCKVLHYHSATLYSARLLSCTVNGTTVNYPKTYNKLALKMGMHYSKESNKKLHGIPEIGDICATSIKLNFYVRCQVLKILNRYERGNPNKVLVKLIDEERLEVTRDIYLYHLPDELKQIETRVVQVRLANIQPKDKDITFSELARDRLKKIIDTDTELFVRGKVALTLGNCIFVNTLEACQDLTSLNEVVVKYNLKEELLKDHAIPNPEHLPKLEKLCTESGLIVKEERNIKPRMPIKNLPKGSWAHLERDSLSSVFYASAINPDKFFVRLEKFESCMAGLLQDIKKYVDSNPTPCNNVKEGEIVLVKFPGDDTYERARIDRIKEETAKCFFVDQGDWKEIHVNDVIPITEKLINQLPFQAIECRLVGIRPLGQQWTDFSTNWFIDNCHNDQGDLKCLFVKYFTKEPAEFTNGHKYSVAVVDVSTEQDVILNQLMIDLNLAQENLSEIKYLDDLGINKPEQKLSTDTEDDVREEDVTSGDSNEEIGNDNIEAKHHVPLQSNILFKAPIRSVPVVNSDNESEESDRWDIVVDSDTMDLFPALQNLKSLEDMPKVKTENTVKPVERDNKRAETVELDSDDLTSPDNTFMEPVSTNEELEKKAQPILDLRPEIDEKRRPKLIWRQNKTSVTIKIQLIEADNYKLNIEDRTLVFSADVNNTEYGFDLQLYGAVYKDECSHGNKGQYILVKLKKVATKNWLTLTRDGGIKKWIVYDVDNLDTSDEEVPTDSIKDVIQNRDETESEDENSEDDSNRVYKKYI